MQTLDVDECASFLKVHPTTVLELAAAGELPGAKIGRAWVFLQDDVVEYLRGQVRAQVLQRKNDQAIQRVADRQVKAILPNLKPGRRRNPLPALP